MKLFDTIHLGDYELSNRVFMAPLTRGRAGPEGVPNRLMAEYYEQRVSAGLIISEATAVSAMGHGWLNSPGIYTDAQQSGWNEVSAAVHARQGRIFMQIWHMGGLVLPDFIGGQLPLAPSEILAEGAMPTPSGLKKQFVMPRALSVAEIKKIVIEFKNAAVRAISAGFDGVEIHAANGFLIDQFLRDSTNKRNDQYGGSIENRARIRIEITAAIVAEIGAGKVGVRLAPTNNVWGNHDSQPEFTYPKVAELLDSFQLAYLHVFEPASGKGHFANYGGSPVLQLIRNIYAGLIVANGGYSLESGQQSLADSIADAIAYGTPFLANPDLVERFKNGNSLNNPEEETFYTPGPDGYTDYPRWELEESAAA